MGWSASSLCLGNFGVAVSVSIVTDSTCDLSKDLTDQKGIHVVPMQVFFGAQCFKDRVTLSVEELYSRLSNGREMATTSQPSPHDFVDVYSRIPGEIVSIHLASVLSGTCNAARKAKEMMGADGYRITIYDSGMVTLGLGLMVLAAWEAAGRGESPAQIVEDLTDLRRSVRILFTLSDLTYLSRGGRIGKAEALVGNLLKIRPILTYDNHIISVIGKAFSTEQAVDRIIEIAKRDNQFTPIKRIFVAHGACADQLEMLESKVRHALTGDIEVYHGEIGSAIAVHAGPKALGIMYHS